MSFKSNILDPVHAELDNRVWDAPESLDPKLKPEHKTFIINKIYHVLGKHGYEGMEKWLSLVLTGSLTTYQYSDESDCDISLWVDTEHFPDWSRAEMIGIMISECDGTTLPGTPHPLQGFVVASHRFRKEDLYKPGLRSGYDINADHWLVPPDKSRIHDVQREEVEAYAIALENADKMEKLLRYEPDKAVMFWHQIHKRRMRDMQGGRGDFSPSNISYKMLSQRGLFPQIEEVSGEHIASSDRVRHAMAIDPADLANWIAENGPYLYHGAHPRDGADREAVAASILRDGIMPGERPNDEYPGHPTQNPCPGCGANGSAGDDGTCNVCGQRGLDYSGELDSALEEWWHHPRPNHVFMVTDPEMAYGAPTFRVDLRRLDPTKLKADDDYLRDYHPDKLQFHKWTQPTAENPPQTLGEQAQALDWGDDSADTRNSLSDHGVVAHEGPVPPEALERIA